MFRTADIVSYLLQPHVDIAAYCFHKLINGNWPLLLSPITFVGATEQ